MGKSNLHLTSIKKKTSIALDDKNLEFYKDLANKFDTSASSVIRIILSLFRVLYQEAQIKFATDKDFIESLENKLEEEAKGIIKNEQSR